MEHGINSPYLVSTGHMEHGINSPHPLSMGSGFVSMQQIPAEVYPTLGGLEEL